MLYTLNIIGTVTVLIHPKNKIFDVILDDSDTGEIWGKKNKHDAFVWKDYLATDGPFISETVNGDEDDS